ncbi:MAG: hypothetical protein ACXACY_25965, partial [Candidatus Hodarchaeales archaeon]
MADEEIRIEISVQAQKSIEETVRLRKQINELKTEAKIVAKETGEGFDKIFASIKRVRLNDLQKELTLLKSKLRETGKDEGAFRPLQNRIEQTKQKMRELREASSLAFREIKEGSKQAQGGVRGLIDRFRNLGGVATLVAGIIGVSLVQAFRKVIDLAQEVIERGKEIQEVFFVLEVGIRGLQRAGIETTIAGWNKQLAQLKKQFPIFTRKEFAESAALATLMTREFGFTEQQIAGVVQQASLLAELTGRDLLESVRGITFAIGSGYFESLQRAGINISRAVVANEALAQGYEGVYNELEPVIRASVTYSVIQKNLNALQEDAGRKIETFAGQILNLRRAWNELLDTLGDITSRSETLIDGLKDLAKILDTVRNILDSISKLGIDPIEIFVNILKTGIFGDAARELENINAVLDSIVKIAVTLNEALTDGTFVVSAFGREFTIQFEGIKNLFGDIAREAENLQRSIAFGGIIFSPEEFDEIIEATKTLQEDIEKIENDASKKRIEIQRDYADDTLEIAEKHNERLADLAEDLANRLADIDINEQRKIADEIANNAFRVNEAIRQANFRREDAERKFRERELKSERRFQEKLRQLRENFLLNLEDAVRERDARQIIRLTRQFNLRRSQMIREEKLNKTDRQNQFQEELRQIERQKQERLRQLAIEHQRRLESIALQAERERDKAQLDFERRQADEDARFIEENEKRRERRDEQLSDLEEDLQERFDALFEALGKEAELTDEQVNAIAKLYESVYGSGGRIDIALQNYQQQLLITEALVKRLNLFIGQMTPLPLLTGAQPGDTLDFAGPQAEGGTIIARKPTVAVFGEAGPEMATFTPLNKLGAGGGAAITPMDAGNMSRDGHIRLEMLLSPDLEARVVDNTLG